jgi:23S rRNA pseudouridine2605 synthase
VLHKPVGVISTLSDPEGRRTLRDFQPPGARVFPVGRLDADTSGLLILTNDGELAHHLMHPRYGVSKLYRVHVDRAPAPEMLRRLQEGIEFEPGVRSAPARVRVRDTTPGAAVIEIELHEGRYRQVRRMCEAAGLRVQRLHRWGYGPLRLGGLERGLWRELSEKEVHLLRAGSARARPLPPGFVRGSARPRGRPPGAGPPRSREHQTDWRTGGPPGERRPGRRDGRPPERGTPARAATPQGRPPRTDRAFGSRAGGPPKRAVRPARGTGFGGGRAQSSEGRTGRAFGSRAGGPPKRGGRPARGSGFSGVRPSGSGARNGRAFGSRTGGPPRREGRPGRGTGFSGGRPSSGQGRSGRAFGSRAGGPPKRDGRPGRTSGARRGGAPVRGGAPARGGGRPRRAPGPRAGRPRRG